MQTHTDPQLVYNNSIDSTKKFPVSDRIMIPYFSLYSDRIVIHPRPFNAVIKRKYNENSRKNLKKKKFQGDLSKTQRSVIKKKVTAWLSSIQEYNIHKKSNYVRKQHYPVFITLTLSSKQKVTDQVIKRELLDLMIKNLKNKFGVINYFWRAEKQKNGNIHFHLIVDKYVDKDNLRIIWNKVQNKLGIIDQFEKIHGHRNPNSTDVKSAASVTNFVNYVLDYCLKKEKYQKVEGRVFGMSDSLRNLGVYQNVLDSQLSEQLLKGIDYHCFKVFRQDYCTVLIFKKEFYQSSMHRYLLDESAAYYVQLYQKIYLRSNDEPKMIKEFKEQLIMQPKQLTLFELSEKVTGINTYHAINARDENKYRNRYFEKKRTYS